VSDSGTFQRRHALLTSQMKMSHIYQPLMLRVLIENGGRASLRQIAAAFLAKDESQLEYYEQISKTMPGRILANHGLVARKNDGYRLNLDMALSRGRNESPARRTAATKRRAPLPHGRRWQMEHVPGMR
jgi:hypothetical protein